MFIPRKEGTYQLNTKWNGVPVRTVQAVVRAGRGGGAGGSGRVILTGKGLVTAVSGEESVFVIDGSEAGEGEPDVKLSGVERVVEVDCRPIGNSVWEAAYTPVKPGTYLLNVTWAGRLVKECPLKITVDPPSNASKVE